MISNTHSGQEYLAPDAVGRGALFQRPESPPRPHSRVRYAPPCLAGAARGSHLSQASASPTTSYCPVLSMTRRSPAGPKPDQPMVTSGFGAVRVHGLRMIGKGENLFHGQKLAKSAGFPTGENAAVPKRDQMAAILNEAGPAKDHLHV